MEKKFFALTLNGNEKYEFKASDKYMVNLKVSIF